ncbi:hypothetical protein MMC11_003486 [Xylographa trunciseda]|nr:hypothetical protein [Xylographa trunciseda]
MPPKHAKHSTHVSQGTLHFFESLSPKGVEQDNDDPAEMGTAFAPTDSKDFELNDDPQDVKPKHANPSENSISNSGESLILSSEDNTPVQAFISQPENGSGRSTDTTTGNSKALHTANVPAAQEATTHHELDGHSEHLTFSQDFVTTGGALADEVPTAQANTPKEPAGAQPAPKARAVARSGVRPRAAADHFDFARTDEELLEAAAQAERLAGPANVCRRP